MQYVDTTDSQDIENELFAKYGLRDMCHHFDSLFKKNSATGNQSKDNREKSHKVTKEADAAMSDEEQKKMKRATKKKMKKLKVKVEGGCSTDPTPSPTSPTSTSFPTSISLHSLDFDQKIQNENLDGGNGEKLGTENPAKKLSKDKNSKEAEDTKSSVNQKGDEKTKSIREIRDSAKEKKEAFDKEKEKKEKSNVLSEESIASDFPVPLRRRELQPDPFPSSSQREGNDNEMISKGRSEVKKDPRKMDPFPTTAYAKQSAKKEERGREREYQKDHKKSVPSWKSKNPRRDDFEHYNKEGDGVEPSTSKTKVEYGAADPNQKISKLVRYMSRMDTEDSFSQSCAKIEDLLKLKENRKYLVRSFPHLLNSFTDTLKGMVGLSWMKAGAKRFATFLIKICEILDTSSLNLNTQSDKLFEWLCDVLKRNQSGRSHELAYVIQNVLFSMIPQMTNEQKNFLSKSIQPVLGHAFETQVFLTLTSIFSFTLSNSELEIEVFQDFVDVIIGWMIDIDQPEDVFILCSESLEKLSKYFIRDPSFVTTLVSQLIEEMEIPGFAINRGSQSEDVPKLKRIVLLANTLKTLLSTQSVNDKEYLLDSAEKLTRNILTILQDWKLNRKECNGCKIALIDILNDCFSLINTGVDGPSIREFLKFQLVEYSTNSGWKKWPRLSLLSFYGSLISWIETVSSQSVMCEESRPIITLVMKFLKTISDEVHVNDVNYLVEIVHTLLRTRNAPLIQEVYGWLVGKLKDEEGRCTQNQETILFVLACICDIASNRSNSILSLWALNPPIFDILADLIQLVHNSKAWTSILHLLKIHCITHSHFVSSIASQKHTFSTDSHSSQFLPKLMKLWLELLGGGNQIGRTSLSWDVWIFYWIFDFLKSSSSYASILTKLDPEFYERFILTSASKPSLTNNLPALLEFFTTDPNYQNISVIRDATRTTCLEFLLTNEGDGKMTEALLNVLNNQNSILVFETPLEVLKRKEEVTKNGKKVVDEPRVENGTNSMTYEEFNSFLYNFFLVDVPGFKFEKKNSAPSQKSKTFTKNEIIASVDFLLRSKLRSPIGKPQDFFAHLQHLFKKYRMGKGQQNFPKWKLTFIFELEKAIFNCINGSSFVNCQLPEQVKTFFITNKVPCNEWMKRMRPDLLELSLMLQFPSTAYFYASLLGDSKGASKALLQLDDKIGIKGMNETIAFLYLNENYEEAVRLYEKSVKGQDEENHLANDVFKRSQMILKGGLGEWSNMLESGKMDPLFPKLLLSSFTELETKRILDLQSESKDKTDLIYYEPPTSLKMLTLIKLKDLILTNKEVNEKEKEKVELLKGLRMIEGKNYSFVQKWLKSLYNFSLESGNGKKFPKVKDILNYPTNALLILLRLHYEKGEEAARCYLKLSKCLDKFKVDLEPTRAPLFLDLAQRLDGNESFYDEFIKEGFRKEEPSDKVTLIGNYYEDATMLDREYKEGWYNYGKFCYASSFASLELDENDKQDLKVQAVNAYSQFMNLDEGGDLMESMMDGIVFKKNFNLMRRKAQVGLIKLFQQGFDFDPKEVMKTRDWLHFLPEIARTGKLRSFLAEKFPKESSFHLVSFEKRRGKLGKRKGLFDSAAFSITEVNEEAFNPICTSINGTCDILSERIQLKGNWTEVDIGEEEVRETKFLNDIRMVARELERIGTTREEYWYWSIQKIVYDWNKRIVALKKDLARDQNAIKIVHFMQPIFSYLDDIMIESGKIETQAESIFFAKHGRSLQEILHELTESESIEGLSKAFEKLLSYTESFESYSKYSLASVSPRLAQFDFEANDIVLPGCPPDVRIVSIDPVVICLPTKTKPKKLRFQTSQGKIIDYLIKGNENLRIDSGVMQFFNVIRDVIEADTRTYSVTPLGNRGGLIQIVKNAIPIFQIYKKYLQRINAAEKTSEMFWNRMNTIGGGEMDRSNLQVIQKVFEELKEETPSDLISREILVCSEDTESWYKSVKTFTMDSAVGAAVGYVLGLGDRHLDNILVNPICGQLVHVDFSLIFGRGTTLRIPEKVPFRLTHNFATALQYPGPSGPFRVYLDNFLIQIQENMDIALLCLKNIAIANQQEDDSSIDFAKVLKAEISSAFLILRYRFTNTFRFLNILKSDILGAAIEYEESCHSYSTIRDKLKVVERNIGNLSLLLSTLKEKELIPVELKKFHFYCDGIKEQFECKRIFIKTKEKLNKIADEYNEAIVKMKELTSTDFDNLRMLKRHFKDKDEILSRVDDQLKKEKLSQLIATIEKAYMLFKAANTIGKLTRRYNMQSHHMSQILHNLNRGTIDEVFCGLNKVAPVVETFETSHIHKIYKIFLEEDAKIRNQMGFLHNLYKGLKIENIKGEIERWEKIISDTADTLSRYTDDEDIDIFLQFAIPSLKSALKGTEANVNFDFLISILILCSKHTNFTVSPYISTILDDIISLHLKARQIVAQFRQEDYESFHKEGEAILRRVYEVLVGLLPTVKMRPLSSLLEEWETVVKNQMENISQFQLFLSGANKDWALPETSEHLVGYLLKPISEFTVPLTSSLKSTIIGACQLFISAHSTYAKRSYHKEDPLIKLIAVLENSQMRARIIKDTQVGIEGSELVFNWIRSELEQIKWSFAQQLVEVDDAQSAKNLQDRGSTIKQLKAEMKILQELLIQVEDTGVLGNEFVPKESIEMFINFTKAVKIVAQGFYGFESLRFSQSLINEHNECLKKYSTKDSNTREKFFAEEVESTLEQLEFDWKGRRANKNDDDMGWVRCLEKTLIASIQTEVQQKMSLAENEVTKTKKENEALGKLTKKIYRWRRVLANMDPLVQFICLYAKNIEPFEEIVTNLWTPNMIHFWSHMKLEQLISLRDLYSQKFDQAEFLFNEIFALIPHMQLCFEVDLSVLEKQRSGEQFDQLKLDIVIKSLRDRIVGFNINTSAEKLIAESTKPECLAQMFEGWTAWV